MSLEVFSERLRRGLGQHMVGPHAEMLKDIIDRAKFLGNTVSTVKALQDVPRRNPADEVAETVATATGWPVDRVQYVTPEELAPDMLLWPMHGSLWSQRSIEGAFLAANTATRDGFRHVVDHTEGFLASRAGSGIERNFWNTEYGLRRPLRTSFGWVMGNAVANQIAFAIANEPARVAAIERLTLLFVSAPFMIRHPMRPEELLVLIRKY